MSEKEIQPIGFRAENKHTLAAGKGTFNYAGMVAPKSVSQARKDIGSWKKAIKATQTAENPKWFLLQQLYDDIFVDAHLKSQHANRTLRALSERPVLRLPSGEIDEEQTDMLNRSLWGETISKHILESRYRSISLVELMVDKDRGLNVDLVPRENIDPRFGLFYPDYADDKNIAYREVSEYGLTLLEFHEKGNEGLFNSAIPHVLFMRFCQSCWSELCEINGIPPRVLKTNTQDPTMMRRGEQMMRDMGAAAWFIIDENEKFEWAAAATQTGQVYDNLMKVCRDMISLLFSGAIIGQDTKHGNESKEKQSQEMLQVLIDHDLEMLEKQWNTTVLPALKALGVIKGDVSYEYEPAEDTAELWKMTKEILPFKNVDDEWIKDKFGIEVTGDRNAGNPSGGENLNFGFF